MYRLPSLEADGEDCLKLARKWLQGCLTWHNATCSPDQDVELPTRIVDVGPPDGFGMPKVIESGGKHARFLALGYCWGTVPFYNLSVATMTEAMTSLHFDRLPATVRDAILLTRQLGFRYL
ncbi:hypothetical protein PG996_009117 [Apiospora saccharicola]|uniref:Heterokaryon incompatibility domain-containing protein n=1 Tax=Apiospora saccharicola TaxID=335842 RepID=A0ABR1UJV0_9PEZI